MKISMPMRHMLLMLLCCLIPIGLILAVSIFAPSLGQLSALLPYALVLLCPLLMLWMMRGHGHDEMHSPDHTIQNPSLRKKQ